MKLYIKRFIHRAGDLSDFRALRFTRYNQYESMILLTIKYLESHNVQFHYGTKAVNVEFDTQKDKKAVKCITIIRDGNEEGVDLTENDLVFVTNGGYVENLSFDDQNQLAPFNKEIREDGGWDMWHKIATQNPSFGHPNKFCYDPEQSNWMSTIVAALDNRIPPHVRKACKRDPFNGKMVIGGIVIAKDSSWLLNWTLNRQPQFRS